MLFIEKYFWVISTFLVPCLYVFMASGFYIVLYRWKKNALKANKIQPGDVDAAQLRRELMYSGISLLIFACTGLLIFWLYENNWTLLYLSWQRFGAVYFVLSIPLMILFHDLYFYWTHRLLHLPGWYKNIHRIHHLSYNASPFTSLSFHPLEGIIQAAVLPIMVMIIPVQPYALFIFLVYMIYKNVRGHAGYEFTSAAMRNKKRNALHNYAIHHNMHHAEGGSNYGLYFTLWDRLMKTFKKG